MEKGNVTIPINRFKELEKAETELNTFLAGGVTITTYGLFSTTKTTITSNNKQVKELAKRLKEAEDKNSELETYKSKYLKQNMDVTFLKEYIELVDPPTEEYNILKFKKKSSNKQLKYILTLRNMINSL